MVFGFIIWLHSFRNEMLKKKIKTLRMHLNIKFNNKMGNYININ